MDCILPGSSVHGDSPGKNTGVGCHALLQGIFPTQGLKPGLPHCRWSLYHLSHQGSPRVYILALNYESVPLKRCPLICSLYLNKKKNVSNNNMTSIHYIQLPVFCHLPYFSNSSNLTYNFYFFTYNVSTTTT